MVAAAVGGSLTVICSGAMLLARYTLGLEEKKRQDDRADEERERLEEERPARLQREAEDHAVYEARQQEEARARESRRQEEERVRALKEEERRKTYDALMSNDAFGEVRSCPLCGTSVEDEDEDLCPIDEFFDAKDNGQAAMRALRDARVWNETCGPTTGIAIVTTSGPQILQGCSSCFGMWTNAPVAKQRK